MIFCAPAFTALMSIVVSLTCTAYPYAVYGYQLVRLAHYSNRYDAARKGNVSNPGLFEISAAYTSLMKQDYAHTKLYLDAADKMKLNSKLKDQWELTKMLLTINSKNRIDAAFEQQILPSIKWLERRAKADTTIKTGDSWEITTWKNFYRNVLSQIIAKRYDEQGDFYKEVLAIGSSEMIYENNHPDNYSGSIIFLHNNLENKNVRKLYDLLNSDHRTEYENYLINFNTVTKNDVADFIGSVYLREYHYPEAIEWFKKDNARGYQINTNPFIDLIYDKVWPLEDERFSTTKLAFATEMLRLEKLSVSDKRNAAKYYYKMALGMYNMTYYGRAWSLVQYDRNSNEYYSSDDRDAKEKLESDTTFEKEYYGSYKAHAYFKKAMNASIDKNF